MSERGFEVASAYVTLTIDDAAFADQVTEAIEAACAEGGGAGGDVLVQALAAAASRGGDDLSASLVEAISGAGDAMGADIAAGLADTLLPEARTAGEQAGQQLSDALGEAAGAAGDTVGGELGQSLEAAASPAARDAGTRAGQALETGLESATGSLGDQLAAQIGQQLHQGLDAQTAVIMSALGVQLAAEGAGAAALAGHAILGALTAVFAAQGADIGMQAGASIGDGLTAGISDSAAGGADAAAARVADALQAALEGSLTEAGATAGDGLVAGIGHGASQGSDAVAQRISESLQASLETTMPLVGAAAGDALGVGMASAAEIGGGFIAEFERPIEAAAEAAGETAGAAFGDGFGNRALLGVDLIEAGLGTSGRPITPGQQPDPFVPNLAEGTGAWIRASKQGAQEAAQAAWAAYGEQLAELVITPEQFSHLTDAGVHAWAEQVALQATESGAGFVTAFADAVTMGMAGIDWSTLTGPQAQALSDAMRGVVATVAEETGTEAETAMQEVGLDAVAALEAAVASTGSEVADELIARIVRARQIMNEQLAQAAIEAAEEGAQAGGKWADFFSRATSSVRVVFEKNTEKAAAAGAVAGREYAQAMVAQIEATFAQAEEEELDESWQSFSAQLSRVREQIAATAAEGAEEGEEAGTTYGSFFSGAAAAVLGVFAKNPAKDAGTEAGLAFGQAMIEELEAQLATLGEAGGDGFAELLAEQLETQLDLAAAQATAEYEQMLEAGIAQAEAEAAAEVAAMRGDLNLDRMFSNLTQQLPAEFVNAFSLMRQGIALTEEQFAQFSEDGQRQLQALATVLQTDGVQAADKVMDALSTKAYNDRLNPASLMAGASGEAEGVASGLGKVEKAAAGATGAMGGLSSVMMGPWGMAAFAAMSVLPMLSGMFHSSSVSAADFTSAVQQDSNAVGDNTAATIEQTLAKTNLSDISKQLGLSQAQLIEYAAGEADVQQAVTAAYNKQVGALTAAGEAQHKYQGVVTKGAQAPGDTGPNMTLINLQQQKAALDAVTAAVQQAIDQDDAQSQALLAAEQTTQIYNAAVNALGDGMLQQTQQTEMSNAATAQFGDRLLAAQSTTQYMAAAVGAAGVSLQLQAHQTEIANLATIQYGQSVMNADRGTIAFNAALGAAYTSMQEQAQQSALSSVGLLDLGANQSQVNTYLTSAEQSYTQAQQGAQAYNTALSALNGTTNTLLGDEAAFTTSLNGLTTAVGQNGHSLDVNNVKGAANITTITGIANAAQQAATAVYQNDIATGHASNAYQDATNKLGQEKQAFINAADKAGYNKDQVQQLADELFKLPPNINTSVDVDTSSAQNALSSLYNQITQLETEGVNVTSQDVAVIKQHRAAGGPVQAGRPYIVGEQGQELFVPHQAGTIIPANETADLLGRGKSAVFQFFGSQYPTVEQMAELRREFASSVGGGF